MKYRRRKEGTAVNVPLTASEGQNFKLGFKSRCPGEGADVQEKMSWPGKSHGPRSLVDYSPWGHKEQVTEGLHFHFHFNNRCGRIAS